jgi:small-conductance mechanosensitive channel
VSTSSPHTGLWAALKGVDFSWQRLAVVVGVVLAAWLLSRIAQVTLRNAAKRNMMDQGVSYSLGRLIHYFLMSLGVLTAVRILGVDLGSMVILGGALGVGVGFGLQSVVGNFVSGLVLLFEQPIRVGDRVSLGTTNPDAQRQVNGFVHRIGLRATTVVTPDNITLIVPNSEFTTRTIVNWSLGDQRVRVRVVIGVAYESNLARVRSVMERVAVEHPKVLKTPAPVARLTATGDSALEFQLFTWIGDPRDHGPVQTDLRESIVAAFRKEGIAIPFPQRDVNLYTRSSTP